MHQLFLQSDSRFKIDTQKVARLCNERWPCIALFGLLRITPQEWVGLAGE